MRKKARETEPALVKERSPLFSHERKAFFFYLAMIAICLASLGATVAENLWQKYFSTTDAITTPFGIYYFGDTSQWLVDHEQCHYDRLQDIGAVAFYSDYFLGGACIEELRCGATLAHTACSEYPMSIIP